MPIDEPVRLRVARRISADPTSTALLLAGPAALELWPGVRRLGEVDGRALVEAELVTACAERERVPATVAVLARPPRRTPTAFVTRFGWSGDDLPLAEGTLTLTYAPGGQGTPSTSAELVLVVEGLAGSAVGVPALTAMAEGFLANLARAAESRRSAA